MHKIYNAVHSAIVDENSTHLESDSVIHTGDTGGTGACTAPDHLFLEFSIDMDVPKIIDWFCLELFLFRGAQNGFAFGYENKWANGVIAGQTYEGDCYTFGTDALAGVLFANYPLECDLGFTRFIAQGLMDEIYWFNFGVCELQEPLAMTFEIECEKFWGNDIEWYVNGAGAPDHLKPKLIVAYRDSKPLYANIGDKLIEIVRG